MCVTHALKHDINIDKMVFMPCLFFEKGSSQKYYMIIIGFYIVKNLYLQQLMIFSPIFEFFLRKSLCFYFFHTYFSVFLIQGGSQVKWEIGLVPKNDIKARSFGATKFGIVVCILTIYEGFVLGNCILSKIVGTLPIIRGD